MVANKVRKLNVIDFFCGAGGFSEGFRQMGFNIVKGYDNWSQALDTFNHNFETDSQAQDILEFLNSTKAIESLPDTDVIIGSPPCVTFSSSNRSGKADKSTGIDLTKSFLRVVALKKYKKDSRLKAWFMENVVNSIKHLKANYSFKELGLESWAIQYDINPESTAIDLKNNHAILNAADYGSYQARRRVFYGEVIKKNQFIIPNTTHSSDAESLKPNWKTLNDLFSKIPKPNIKDNCEIVDPNYKSIKLKKEELTDLFYDSGLYKSEWRQSKELKTNHWCMGKMSFPENKNKPSRTVTATKSSTSRESLIYKSEYNRKGNGEYRSPTVREIACIMGFPITFQFMGSEHVKWRLIGNAVCPSVSRALASETLKQLDLPIPTNLNLQKTVNLTGINNLNNPKEKLFEEQPKRNKGSRFRRHPIKIGNLTVTLSNFKIENNDNLENNKSTKKIKSSKPLIKEYKWYTSVQYGTGSGFKSQSISDGFYKKIENIILDRFQGEKFIKYMNNGFAKKVACGKTLQELYENQKSISGFLEPTELVELVAKKIKQFGKENEFLKQETEDIFIYKKIIPVNQLFALYAINKISTITNRKNHE